MKVQRYISRILCACICSLLPFSALCLEDYLFTVPKPKLVIYPEISSPVSNQKPSTLVILSRDIAKANYYEKQEYIQIVLSEMIDVYQEEAERAIERTQLIKDKKKINKLYRWSQNARGYADVLAGLYESINNSNSLDVYADKDQSYLLIDNYPVEVTGPVLNQQQQLEDRIVRAVCATMVCNLERLAEFNALSQRNIRIRAGWRLKKDHYVFYTTSGLQFIFSTLENKNLKQKMALKIAADMTLIAEELSLLNEKGVFIDWQHLHLKKNQNSDYSVVINPLGDRIATTLMLLPYIEDFPKKTLPWFKARLKRPSFDYVFPDADSFMRKIYHQG